MIEVYFSSIEDSKWELKATIFPKGGHDALAEEIGLVSVSEASFPAALRAVSADGL